MCHPTYLERSTESVDENSKEQQSTAIIEGSSIRLQVEKDRRDDESHDGVTEQLRQGQAGVGTKTPETTTETEHDLLAVRKSVG